jgi:hypothetical protein
MPSYTCPPHDANGDTIPPGSCCAYWYAGTGNQTDTDIPEEFWCPPGTFTKPEVPCAHSGTASSSATAGEVVAVVAVLGVAGAAGLYLSRHHQLQSPSGRERRRRR